MHEIIYKVKEMLERDIQSLYDEIDNKQTILLELIEYCREKCEHVWIDDLIDIDPDRSKRIIYCEKCELHKE